MKWQEYQDAVAELYDQAEGLGAVSRNVTVPDKVTGQPRQIDVLIEIETKGHTVKLIVDAKFHEAPLDVRDIESVLALAEAVGAHKAIIVAANGWSAPAQTKAEHAGCDLRVLTIDDALELVVPDKWKMCPSCKADCIVLDQDGLRQMEDGTVIWWLAGQCRACKCARFHCQDCGLKAYVDLNESITCGCGHRWSSSSNGVLIGFFEEESEW